MLTVARTLAIGLVTNKKAKEFVDFMNRIYNVMMTFGENVFKHCKIKTLVC